MDDRIRRAVALPNLALIIGARRPFQNDKAVGEAMIAVAVAEGTQGAAWANCSSGSIEIGAIGGIDIGRIYRKRLFAFVYPIRGP
jgi:hypothetical protein